MMYASKRYGHDVWPEVPQSAKEDKIPGSDNPLQQNLKTSNGQPKNLSLLPSKVYLRLPLLRIGRLVFSGS